MMKVGLLKGLDEESKAEVEAEFRNSSRLRAQYVRYLEERIEATQQEMLDEEVRSESGWALSQASKIAEIKAYKKLINYM